MRWDVTSLVCCKKDRGESGILLWSGNRVKKSEKVSESQCTHRSEYGYYYSMYTEI